MDKDAVNILPITGTTTSLPGDTHYAVLLLQKNVEALEINETLHHNVSKSIYFLYPHNRWRILTNGKSSKSGYVLLVSRETLNNPLLKNLHINEVRLLNSTKIPKINLAPGIEKRTYTILEMMDELIGSHLNHKEDAIISLLHTFFVYCDGQCKIKSIMPEGNAQKVLVYKFKTLIDQQLNQYHKVSDYARKLRVSAKYLNECVNEVLNVNAKGIINEQLMMKARHKLKFSNKSIKEISFDLGFSSPSYFSYFFKSHTGSSPSSLRQQSIPKI